MSTDALSEKQGPFEGSRCPVSTHPSMAWNSAVVRRVCEDGTFKIEFYEKQMVLLPYWHGVTAHEISFTAMGLSEADDDPRDIFNENIEADNGIPILYPNQGGNA